MTPDKPLNLSVPPPPCPQDLDESTQLAGPLGGGGRCRLQVFTAAAVNSSHVSPISLSAALPTNFYSTFRAQQTTPSSRKPSSRKPSSRKPSSRKPSSTPTGHAAASGASVTPAREAHGPPSVGSLGRRR